MRLLKAIGIVLTAFGVLGLVIFSCFLFEWMAFGAWMGILFIVMVVVVYKELK